MKKTIVVYGSSTGTCQEIAEQIAGKLNVEAKDVANLTSDDIAENDNLLLGSSTWGAGELQDDWYDGLKTLKNADLSGKTIALFGCGDCESYGDTLSVLHSTTSTKTTRQKPALTPGWRASAHSCDDPPNHTQEKQQEENSPPP